MYYAKKYGLCPIFSYILQKIICSFLDFTEIKKKYTKQFEELIVNPRERRMLLYDDNDLEVNGNPRDAAKILQ